MMLMKAVKINIKPYMVTLQSGVKPIPYDIVTSIENIVCASGQQTKAQLGMADLLRLDKILNKFRIAREEKRNEVLLTEEEYGTIKDRFEAFTGVGKFEIELCKRIDQPEIVEVKEVKKDK